MVCMGHDRKPFIVIIEPRVVPLHLDNAGFEIALTVGNYFAWESCSALFSAVLKARRRVVSAVHISGFDNIVYIESHLTIEVWIVRIQEGLETPRSIYKFFGHRCRRFRRKGFRSHLCYEGQ